MDDIINVKFDNEHKREIQWNHVNGASNGQNKSIPITGRLHKHAS